MSPIFHPLRGSEAPDFRSTPTPRLPAGQRLAGQSLATNPNLPFLQGSLDSPESKVDHLKGVFLCNDRHFWWCQEREMAMKACSSPKLAPHWTSRCVIHFLRKVGAPNTTGRVPAAICSIAPGSWPALPRETSFPTPNRASIQSVVDGARLRRVWQHLPRPHNFNNVLLKLEVSIGNLRGLTSWSGSMLPLPIVRLRRSEPLAS